MIPTFNHKKFTSKLKNEERNEMISSLLKLLGRLDLNSTVTSERKRKKKPVKRSLFGKLKLKKLKFKKRKRKLGYTNPTRPT